MDNGIKYDNDKIQMELLPLRELKEIARVLTYGAKKYAPENWKKVPDMKERNTGALLRHLTAYREGETFDLETGDNPQYHIAEVACNAIFLLWKELEDWRDVPEPAKQTLDDEKLIDDNLLKTQERYLSGSIGILIEKHLGEKSGESLFFDKVIKEYFSRTQ